MTRKLWREANGLKGDEEERRPADRHGAFEGRHLAKYIFPKQYGLNNVFARVDGRMITNGWSGQRFWNREAEIKVEASYFAWWYSTNRHTASKHTQDAESSEGGTAAFEPDVSEKYEVPI